MDELDTKFDLNDTLFMILFPFLCDKDESTAVLELLKKNQNAEF